MREYEVRRLIRLVEESEIGELEVWRWWGRIRIRKEVPGNGALPQIPASGTASDATQSAAAPAAPAPAPAEVEEDVQGGNDAALASVKSPMVGTFYRAPAPDAEPYVQPGDDIATGQTVCIIEAMKLMNEIQSETDGKIVKILVENSQPVEFGQDLFLVKTH